MVFVLDNYDSFTYNLVQYIGELGAEMVIKRNDELTPADVEALRPDRIVISPASSCVRAVISSSAGRPFSSTMSEW